MIELLLSKAEFLTAELQFWAVPVAVHYCYYQKTFEMSGTYRRIYAHWFCPYKLCHYI